MIRGGVLPVSQLFVRDKNYLLKRGSDILDKA